MAVKYKKRFEKKAIQYNRKTNDIRTQFNRAKNKYLQRIAYEEARKGVTGIYETQKQLFKNIDFKKIKKEGITRKIDGRTVRIRGTEAVRLQIKSLERRANPEILKNQYIANYLTAMRKVGFKSFEIDQVRSAMQRLSAEELGYMVDSGILPDISFFYAGVRGHEELLEEILIALDQDVSAEVKKRAERARRLLYATKK